MFSLSDAETVETELRASQKEDSERDVVIVDDEAASELSSIEEQDEDEEQSGGFGFVVRNFLFVDMSIV